MIDLKILLVDDFEITRKQERNILKELGYTRIDDASDGVDAKAKILKAESESMPYELILCDWNMPNMNGIDLLKFLRSEQKFKSLPFIMVSAESESESVILAIETGATDYLFKPFSKEEFSGKVKKMISKLAQKK